MAAYVAIFLDVETYKRRKRTHKKTTFRKGDLVEFARSNYIFSHWAVYIGMFLYLIASGLVTLDGTAYNQRSRSESLITLYSDRLFDTLQVYTQMLKYSLFGWLMHSVYISSSGSGLADELGIFSKYYLKNQYTCINSYM